MRRPGSRTTRSIRPPPGFQQARSCDIPVTIDNFNKNLFKFHIDNNPVELTSTEFKLLLFLCERIGQPQDRNDLLRAVWNHTDETHSRTLDTHIKRLRQKLTPYGRWIETVRGFGYRVANPAG